MELEAIFEFLNEEKIEYRKNEPMSEHTSFRIGGNADALVFPKTENELLKVLEKARESGVPVFILGNGSNILVSDRGIDGIVISLCEMKEITVNGKEITAFAGANLSQVCVTAQKSGLSGLEFAYGIPGSVGGALYMNAGAYGGETADVIKSAAVIDRDGRCKEILKDEMALGYRKSIFKSKDYVIVKATFSLFDDDCGNIKSRMEDFLQRRKSKQPLEYPSAGSTFKRPEGNFAGALIEKNGLKGKKIGGAKVSEKHAGFIINCGNATAEDVKKLMKEVADTVYKADGVMLEPEVIFVGRNED